MVKKRKVRTHKFNGYKFNIDVYEPFTAVVESPRDSDNKPSLRVAIDIKTKEGLICLLHEALHASAWAKTEELADRAAEEVGSFLWRLGFRLR